MPCERRRGSPSPGCRDSLVNSSTSRFVRISSFVNAINGFRKWTLCSVRALYVVFDVFRVGGDHRAVVVVSCFRGFVALVRNARIENVRSVPGGSAIRHDRARALPGSIRIRSGSIQYQVRRSFSWTVGTERRGNLSSLKKTAQNG